STDVDVVVVGAGPTGLLLAGDLARAGVSCVVLERHAERSSLTRAFAVHARTLEQLDARGVADELVATGTPESTLRFLGTRELRLPRLPSRFPYVLITPQYETERVLAGRARSLGADLRYGTHVTGLARFPDRVEVIARPGGRPEHLIRASYVVGADGMHSTVRDAIGMPFPGRAVVQSVMLADVRLRQAPPDTLTLNTAGDAFALIAPFGDGWFRIIAWHRRNQPPDDVPVSLEEVADVARRALGTDYGPHDPRWMSRFHSEERQAPRYRDGRVLLAGDAAHVHSPAGGQGMNTGLQDAANLGWKLAATVRGWAPDGLLDTYQAERHPVGRQVLRTSGALLKIGLTGPPLLVAARNIVAAAATRTPFGPRVLAGAISGLSISYPAPRGAHPLTGRRVADLPLADGPLTDLPLADGPRAGRRRLYEALRTGRFLLAGGPGTLPADAAAGFTDRVDTAEVARPTGIVALIRPDAYIAWAHGPASDGDRTPQLRAALTRWCGTGRPGSLLAPRVG
ncbi:MAG TPA: FAD-dependent monooxygenase, partial [Streptosporangiaceae bacterium]|nr:FAD-dependent monooxygenase [Streptosporangiaceae bacterium]